MENIDVFYSESGNAIYRSDIEKLPLFPLGDYGRVYHDGDKAIKLLNNPGTVEQYKVVSTIKNLKLANFYEIYDVLSCNNTKVRSFGGTISKYYEQAFPDSLTTPSDYFLESYYHLSNSFYILGQNGIDVQDLYSKNCILADSGVTIIDVDLYNQYTDISSDALECISRSNLFKLKYHFFLSLFVDHFFKYHGDDFSCTNVTDFFTSFIGPSLPSDTDDDAFCYNLGLYKYPIDYVKKKIK